MINDWGETNQLKLTLKPVPAAEICVYKPGDRDFQVRKLLLATRQHGKAEFTHQQE